MTPIERALWASAQEDYTNALKIAVSAWKGLNGAAVPEDAVLQSTAATILIHVTKLREQNTRANAQPPVAKAEGAPQQAVPTVCPKCNKSPMWDNRKDKKNPKGPDFKCKDKDCGHPIWLDRKPRKDFAEAAVAAAQRDVNESPFAEEGSDDLPF
jgi:hypothetical protein